MESLSETTVEGAEYKHCQQEFVRCLNIMKYHVRGEIYTHTSVWDPPSIHLPAMLAVACGSHFEQCLHVSSFVPHTTSKWDRTRKHK